MSEQEQQAHPLRHVAIIMDGNNRWARARDLPGVAGHRAGAERLEDIVSACREADIRILTVFAFSSENWQRPKQEVGSLMSLFATTLKKYRRELVQRDVRLRVIGRRDRLSDRLNKLISQVESDTAGGKYQLNIAADYGGRWDIAEAARTLAGRVVRGDMSLSELNEESLAGAMSLADLPEPDLLIRTGGEYRISNFMLWQLSYTELYFSQCYWPDFDRACLRHAIDEYYLRQRRFGAHPDQHPLNLASGGR